MLKEFIKGVIPSIIASVVLGTFSIVDGLFIGNKLGDTGLAAINYAYPITAFIQALGFGLGMGGAIYISINIGKGDKENEKKYLSNAYFLLLLFSLVVTVVFLLSYKPMLHLFGAYNEAYRMACDYIFIIILGSAFQIIGQALVPILRNYNYNAYTMLSMSLGFIANIILDYVLIYVVDIGLKGAAIGTLVAQVITAVMLIAVLFKKKYRPIFDISIKKIKDIMISGLSSFGIFFAPSFVLILINKAASIYGGDVAVAAYTAASYITFIVIRLLQGVCDGTQPKLSFYFGLGDDKKLKTIFKYGFILIMSISVIVTIFIITARSGLSLIFGLSTEGKDIFKTAILILSIPFIPLALMKIIMCYFGAVKKNIYALILSYAESVITLILVFLLPKALGIDGIWYTTLIAECASGLIAIILIIIDKLLKNKNNIKHSNEDNELLINE